MIARPTLARRAIVAGAPSASYREQASRNNFQADCKAHVYSGITPYKAGEIIKRLQGEGMTVSGTNPYDVDTHQHGIALYAEWNQAAQELYVDIKTISRTFGLPTCAMVWDEVDKQIGIVQALPEPVAPPPAPVPVPAAPTPPPVVAPMGGTNYPTPEAYNPGTWVKDAVATPAAAPARGGDMGLLLTVGGVLAVVGIGLWAARRAGVPYLHW